MIVVKEKKRRHALMLLIKFCPREAKFFQNKIKIYASAARPNSVLVGTFVYLFIFINLSILEDYQFTINIYFT